VRDEYKILLASLKGRDYSEDLGVDVRIILKWVIEKWDCRMWIEFMWLRIGTSNGLFNTLINLWFL
jgi:hypothetical protein